MTTPALVVLQACGIDGWLSGDWGSCFFGPVTGQVSAGVFGLILGVGIYSSLYFAAGGQSTTATVVTILLASVLLPVLPGAYSGIAWTVLFVGATGAVLQALQKYMLNPATARP